MKRQEPRPGQCSICGKLGGLDIEHRCRCADCGKRMWRMANGTIQYHAPCQMETSTADGQAVAR